MTAQLQNPLRHLDTKLPRRGPGYNNAKEPRDRAESNHWPGAARQGQRPSANQEADFGRAQSKKLVTVYFDTPDHEFRQQGMSHRVPKVGRPYVQCVLLAHSRMGGIPVWMEWDGPVPSQEPAISVIEDKRLRRLIRRAGAERLQPVFRTDVQRRSRSPKFDDGSTVSLDLDVGDVKAGDVAEAISELELELESGAPERLFELASDIRQVVPFRLATMGKALRGYALLIMDAAQPRKYVKLKFVKDATLEQVVTEMVQHCLDHLTDKRDRRSDNRGRRRRSPNACRPETVAYRLAAF